MKKTIKAWAVSWEGNLDTWSLDKGCDVVAIFKTKKAAKYYNEMASDGSQDIFPVLITLPTKKK